MQAPTQSGQAASSVVRLERKRKRTKDCSGGRGSKFPKEEKPFFFFFKTFTFTPEGSFVFKSERKETHGEHGRTRRLFSIQVTKNTQGAQIPSVVSLLPGLFTQSWEGRMGDRQQNTGFHGLKGG